MSFIKIKPLSQIFHKFMAIPWSYPMFLNDFDKNLIFM